MKTFKVMTALITPFKKNGSIDYEALDGILQEQLLQGVDGLIVCGTTAETPCLKEHERFDLLRWILNRTHHQVEIWFGCGTNNTQETMHLVKKASLYDIDGVLLVTPYYNKPSQAGLYRHFKTIAESSDLDIMLYQVPSRCGIAFEATTLQHLFTTCPNIKALKHASDDYELIASLKQRFPHISFYSGEDKTFFQGMGKGLDGLISVMSNAYLKEVKAYVEHPSLKQEAYLKQLSTCVFQECSPSAIKYMMSKLGKCENVVRLPLVPISHTTAKKIDAFMANDKNQQISQ